MGNVLELAIVSGIFMLTGWHMGQSSMKMMLTRHILRRRNEIYNREWMFDGDTPEKAYVKALYWTLEAVNRGNWKKTASRIRSNERNG